MRYYYLLSLLVFSACGTDIFSDPPYPKCDCSQEFLPAATCESAKILCRCPPPKYPPANPATCPEIVIDHIGQVFHTRDWLFYASLLSPDFVFTDETIGLEVVGKEPEVRALMRIFTSYRRMQYSPEFVSRQYTDDGCFMGCGTVGMSLINVKEIYYPSCNSEFFTSGFSVADETCLTICPGDDDLWYLTEWRILKKLPAKTEKLEVATWGEVKTSDVPTTVWSPDPPDSVWVESIEVNEVTGGIVTLGFSAVEEAHYYEIHRLLWTTTIEEDGERVTLDEPMRVWAFWGSHDPKPPYRDTIQTTVALLDDPTPEDQLAIVSVSSDEIGHQVHSDRAVVSLDTAPSYEIGITASYRYRCGE